MPVLLLDFSAKVSSATTLCGLADMHKKPTGLSAGTQDGSDITADILCGDDAALAAARVATHRKHKLQDGELVLVLAKRLHEVLQLEAERGNVGYITPDNLGVGTQAERPRQMKTGGQHARRAKEHSHKGEFREAVADLLRALLRPKIDETARDKLMANMEDYLKKGVAAMAKKSQDGDLSELLEALDLEDTGDDNSDGDRSAIKRAYRDLSVKYHPDKNKGSAERFNKIRDAYEILSDPVKTLLYDTGGIELVRNFEKDGGDMPKTESKDVTMTVSLQDVYKGTTKSHPRSRRVVCRSCRLQPHLQRCRKCKRCPGELKERQRWISRNRYTIEEVEEPSEDFCENRNDDLPVNIERGMMGGDRVSFPHMASQLPKKVPGDISVRILIRPDQVFQRIGNDLLVTVRVSLFEALLGFERKIRHLDGHVVTVKVDRGAVIRPHSGLEISGEGMPLIEDPTSFGKLVVKFEIDFPEKLNANQASQLEDAMQALGLGPRDTGMIGGSVPRLPRSEL